jgi:hypothetical protein
MILKTSSSKNIQDVVVSKVIQTRFYSWEIERIGACGDNLMLTQLDSGLLKFILKD